jgi:Ca-activated chloride channel homolog
MRLVQGGWFLARQSIAGALVAVLGASGCSKHDAPATSSSDNKINEAPVATATAGLHQKRAESGASGERRPASPAAADGEQGLRKGDMGRSGVAGPNEAPGRVAAAAPPPMGAGAAPRLAQGGGFAGVIAPHGPNGLPQQPLPTATRPAEAVIDPNGRFATTYRPGGGHLSAFESAVSRGIVPGADRELVSDVGARYAPSTPVPAGKALGIQADLERGKAPPAGGEAHVRIALRSSDKAPTERPHLSVHLVLDVSGSMAGESIDNARKASQALVDKLAPGDDFSLVTFSSDAEVKIADGPVGARREQIKQTIAGIKEGGGTNISAGLKLGYGEAARASIPKDAVRVVLLLSDGHVNAGILDKGRLSRLALDAFQGGVQTSTFGLGADYDGPLMSSIAADGAGGYYYLRDAQQIAPALATELDKRLDPVATAVEVRIRLKKGIELLHVYGSRRLNDAEAERVRTQEVAADQQAEKKDGIKRDREDDLQGGMRFFMPAFARDDSHAMLLKVRLPAGVGSKPLALIEIKYKDRITKKNVSDEFPVNITYGASDAESGGSIDASMARTIQGFAAGEALAEAGARVERGDRAGAAALLSEREDILRKAAEQLNEPLFLKDADRLARLRTHTGETTGVGDPLVLAMLLETAGRVHLH